CPVPYRVLGRARPRIRHMTVTTGRLERPSAARCTMSLPPGTGNVAACRHRWEETR
ncbi:MAG: hypothetical protein AVDCRST_MAG34-1777, partial [uncultured Nocardioidaceae bacterium]